MGLLFKHKYATHPCAIVNENDHDLFIRALKKKSKVQFDEREHNELICPSIFDPNLSSESDRGKVNAVYANGIWLDFDHGNLTHKTLADIFPHVRIVAFNTFTSTKAQPRFRVFIPTSRTMTVDEYEHITEQIVQAVKGAGYWLAKRDENRPELKAHGIDMTKLHAASLFYLPCAPKDPKGKLWKDHHGPFRKPLDVDGWLEYAIPVEVRDDAFGSDMVTSAANTNVAVDQARVDQAMVHWNTTGVLKGEGDSGMWRLADELERAGVPGHEQATMLLQAARNANSPQDRTRQAQRIVRSRQRFGRR